jgi:hypothetical protein
VCAHSDAHVSFSTHCSSQAMPVPLCLCMQEELQVGYDILSLSHIHRLRPTKWYNDTIVACYFQVTSMLCAACTCMRSRSQACLSQLDRCCCALNPCPSTPCQVLQARDAALCAADNNRRPSKFFNSYFIQVEQDVTEQLSSIESVRERRLMVTAALFRRWDRW